MRLKKILRDLITASVENARSAGQLTCAALPAFHVEACKHADHGDLFTNLAMMLAKQAKLPPRKVAETIVNNLAAPEGSWRRSTAFVVPPLGGTRVRTRLKAELQTPS